MSKTLNKIHVNVALTQTVSHPSVLHFITFWPSWISESAIVTPQTHTLSWRSCAFLIRNLRPPSDGAALVTGNRSGVIARALVRTTTAAEFISRGGPASVVRVDVVAGLCVAIVTEVGVSAALMGAAVGVPALRGPVS
jgi:hypothetical protein